MSSDEKENENNQPPVGIELQLGDIIQIFIKESESQANKNEYEKLNNQVFIIDYIDSKKMHIINDETLDTIILNINDGIIANGIIQNIIIKDRNKYPGYARQNDLVPGQWINIYFGGDVPAIITGEITNLEEDMIEVKTYPENSVIYINFDYKGIPDNLPIETIEIREKPISASSFEKEISATQAVLSKIKSESENISEKNENLETYAPSLVEKEPESPESPESPKAPKDYELEEGEIYEVEDEDLDQEIIINIPSSEIKQQLREFILKADEIVFGDEEVGNIVQYINIDESRQRYSIEAQTNELLDELISAIPNKGRTTRVLNNIHIMIERFKQLRNTFSTFDENYNVNGMKFKEANWKPLVENLFHLKKSLYWILPVVKNMKKMYNIDEANNNINDYPDIVSLSLSENMTDFEKIFNNYKSDDTPVEINKYVTMMKEMNPYMTPFENNTTNRENQEISINQYLNKDYIYNTTVNDNFEALIDNLSDFYSSVFNSNLIKSKRFVIGKYNLGINKLDTVSYLGNKTKTQLVTLTKPDSMNIKSIIMLPKDAVVFSRVQLPGTNIMEKANLNNTFLNYWQLLNKNTYIENQFIDNENLKLDRRNNNLPNQAQAEEQQEKSRNFLKKPMNYILDIDIENFINDNKVVENMENDPNNNLINMQNKINNISVEYEKLYYDFLRAIVPKTRSLFYTMQKDIHNKFTFKDVVEYFEPFLIYQDDITFLQYNAIVKFINYKIIEFNKSYAEKYRYFQNIKNMNFIKKPTANINKMYNLLNSITYSINNSLNPLELGDAKEDKEYAQPVDVERNLNVKEIIIEKYHINDPIQTQAQNQNQPDATSKKPVLDSSEILNKINAMDNGRLFNSGISLNNLPLMFSDNLNSFFENENTEVKNDKQFMESRFGDKCKNYIIAKQYQNINELNDDNNDNNENGESSKNQTTIYFDKKFDTTNYSLLNQYEKEMNKMESDEFINFLIEKLQKSEKLSREDTVDLVETLITGMKEIKDGHYAMLYDTVNDIMHYYVRKNGNWVLDENIDKDGLSSFNNQNMLCNLQKDCISITNNSIASGMDCKTEDYNKSILTENALKTIMSEFDKQYYQSKEELENKIKSVFEYYTSIFEKCEKIQNQRVVKYNNQQYLLGLEELKRNDMDIGVGVDENDTSIDANPYACPYSKLRDMILGQSDFVKKQNDIIRFTQMFTRENMKDTTVGPLGEIESIHWRYCVKTNVKVLPTFLYTLACVFINDNDNYNEKVEYVIKDIGALSDDDGAWVDKHSGYVIKNINFNAEEGYEGGIKIKSREIMETETASGIASVVSDEKGRVKQLEEEVKQKMAKKLSPENKIVMNIVNTLSQSCMVDISQQHEFIMKMVGEALLKALPKESDYNNEVKEMANKGKTLPPYKTIYNSTILYVTMGMFLIAVQTHMPSIKTKKTFPGCVRSFNGFPIDGDSNSDFSSVEYIACIGYNIRSSVDPWSALQKQKRENIANRLKDTIQKILLFMPDVDRKIKDKLEYNIAKESRVGSKPVDEEEEDEHDIKTWTSFLPPLVNFKIRRLSNITSEFKSSLLSSLKTGGSNQREKILVVESKIIEFSLAIQEKIQQIISKKKLLLTNMANEPFVENACCNETDIFSTIRYFEKESNGEIGNHNRIVEELSNILIDINAITKSPYIFSKENTKNQYPAIANDFDEETIYRAFIVYCKFNSLIPTSEELISLCNEKPKNISSKDSYNEIILKLKKDGRNYTHESLLRLLQLVNRKNIVDIEMNNTTINPTQMMRNVLENFDFEKEEVVYPSLQKLLVESLDVPATASAKNNPNNPNSPNDEIEDSKEVRALKNHLSRTNDDMKKDITEFIKKNYKMTGIKQKEIDGFLNELFEWGCDDEIESRHTDCLNKMLQFIKTYIQNFASVFPNIILNTVDYEKIIIPKYLGLSITHTNDIKNIIKNYYEKLRPYYKNSHVSSVLYNVQNKTKNLLMLINETPFLTASSTSNSIFDVRLSKLLLEQFLLVLFMEYVNLANNDSMLFGVDIIKEEVKSKKTKSDKKRKGRGSQLTIEEPDRDFSIEDVFTVENLEEREQFIGLENEVFENEFIRAPGELKKLQTNIANLLLQYMAIMRDHKDIIDLSYDKIMDKVFKIKEREKDTFTDRLKSKTKEERNVDTIMKINKLGEWGKGLQKGLTTYVKENYDEERDMMMNITAIERIVRKNPDVTDENVAQYVDDYLYNQNMDLETEREAYDMTNQIDDYNDGNFEGDEVENWDEYDS
uniref:Uncharacterized protein n=1 Tax=viral metagenome TaxID=1070528 RepID=A0A6C0EDV6_9ZZZZ